MEDTKIVELYLIRDEKAIYETKNKYGKYCNLIAFNILKVAEDAEECEQDTYIKTWESIPPTRPNSLKAYVGKIARNIAIGRYRYYHADKRNQHAEVIIEELEEVISANETVESEASFNQLTEAINHFLEGLDKEGRILFVKRYYKADEILDICESMGISRAKAETKLSRIRKKLKEYLEREGYKV